MAHRGAPCNGSCEHKCRRTPLVRRSQHYPERCEAEHRHRNVVAIETSGIEEKNPDWPYFRRRRETLEDHQHHGGGTQRVTADFLAHHVDHEKQRNTEGNRERAHLNDPESKYAKNRCLDERIDRHLHEVMSFHPVESGKEVRPERPGGGEFVAARRNPRLVLTDGREPIDPGQGPNEIENNRCRGNETGPLRISELPRLEHPTLSLFPRPLRPTFTKDVRMWACSRAGALRLPVS